MRYGVFSLFLLICSLVSFVFSKIIMIIRQRITTSKKQKLNSNNNSVPFKLYQFLSFFISDSFCHRKLKNQLISCALFIVHCSLFTVSLLYERLMIPLGFSFELKTKNLNAQNRCKDFKLFFFIAKDTLLKIEFKLFPEVCIGSILHKD